MNMAVKTRMSPLGVYAMKAIAWQLMDDHVSVEAD